MSLGASESDAMSVNSFQSEFWRTDLRGRPTSALAQRNMAETVLAPSQGIVGTKIVCTVGPATHSKEEIGALVEAGMNVMRLNFSHGSHEYHAESITNLRAYLSESKKLCAVMLDTQGPEIRTRKLQGGGEVQLEKGTTFTLVNDEDFVGDATAVSVTYPDLASDLVNGDIVLLDDGLIELRVTSVDKESGKVETKVLNTGMLGERKGVNLPGTVVRLPATSDKDKDDLVFGVKQGVDFVAASFVRKAEDVREIRDVLGPKGANIKIISKIESQEGLENFDEILEESDGIMVARGDLGVEIPAEKVFLAQKMMIKKCNTAGKPVITATQMLESMVKNPRPTRAEATDVANSVFDGTDAVMLSGETAKGAYPVKAVQVQGRICREAERAVEYSRLYQEIRANQAYPINIAEAVAASSVRTAQDLNASMIIVLTETGRTAHHVAKYRPKVPVLSITSNERAARQLLLVRNVIPLLIGSMIGTSHIMRRAMEKAVNLGICQKGDLVVVTSGAREGVSGATNVLSVEKV